MICGLRAIFTNRKTKKSHFPFLACKTKNRLVNGLFFLGDHVNMSSSYISVAAHPTKGNAKQEVSCIKQQNQTLKTGIALPNSDNEKGVSFACRRCNFQCTLF